MTAVFTLCPGCASSEVSCTPDPRRPYAPERFVCRQCGTVWVVVADAKGDMPHVEVLERHTPKTASYSATS